MFFNDISEISEIVKRTSCAVFAVPTDTKIKLKNVFYLSPDEDKKHISVEQIREFLALTNTKQTTDQYLVITPADAMNDAAQNAFLKNLEEPQEHIHFVLLTENPTALLPTVLSRAELYYLKKTNLLDQKPTTKEEILDLAKQLISATPSQLPNLAEKIAKSKPNARAKALEITAIAIELLYKSYFITKNPKLLEKIPKFTGLYDNLQANGHIKLHLVADLC